MAGAAGRLRNFPTSIPFWALSGLLIIAALTGGTSRGDAQSLLFLRPVSFLACGWALLTLKKEHLDGRRLLLSGMLAIIAINLTHLIPLPPELWRNLPGRDDVAKVDTAVNLVSVWRPISIAPLNGWNTAATLFAPLAVLLFGVQLSREDLHRLLFVLLGIGALSGIFGMLQAVDSNVSALYLYRITNTGSSVGLFANRNHAATLLACLFPLLAVFITRSANTDDRIRRQILAAAFTIMLIPIILITGSRSGLFLSIVGLVAGALLLRSSVKEPHLRRTGGSLKRAALPIISGIAVICLSLITFVFSRAEAVERLFRGSFFEEGRTGFWKVSIDLLLVCFPLGSGSGSFSQAYQLLESTHTLNQHYLNHAHNDWIETATTYGLPGIVCLGAVVLLYSAKTWTIWLRMDGRRSSVVFSRMGGTAIAIIAIASISDYPLRTPAFMCVFAILMLWFAEAGRRRDL